ncbi:helix-turn-helix domain-containing protein, partial [Alistipes putredinis]
MKYSYEEKLTAVLSVVRGQHSVSSASKHFGISYTPLSRWIARYKEFGEAGL